MSKLYIINQNKWTNAYEHTMDFLTITKRDAWMDARIIDAFDTLNKDFVFIEPDKSINVYREYDEIKNYSYCMFENNGRRYYAFVTSVDYINAKVSRMNIEIDVMQTYAFDYELGHSFVEREHQNRVTFRDGSLKRNYSRTDEMLDVGKDYLKISGLSSSKIRNGQSDDSYMCVIITSDIIGEPLTNQPPDTPFTEYASTTRYSTYVVPVFTDSDHRESGASGYRVELSDGTNTYRGANLTDIMRLVGNNNKVVSISLVPFEFFEMNRTTDVSVTPRTTTYENTGANLSTSIMSIAPAEYFRDAYVFKVIGDKFEGDFGIEVDTRSKEIPAFVSTADNPSTDFIPENESKIYTHPFRIYNIYNNLSNLKEFKQENIEGDDFVFRYKVSLGAQIKEELSVVSKDPYDLIINNGINDLPLSNDAFLNYLQSNKASAIAGMAIPALTFAGGLAMTATGVGAGAGVPLMIGGAMSASASIGSQVARHYDIKNQPDAMRSAGNNAMFDIVGDYGIYRMDILEVNPQAKSRIIQYLHRFGYKVNDFKTPDLRSRRIFNFIKTLETTITGNLNTVIKNQIKTIFQRGVTIWHSDKNNIGTDDPMHRYDLENYERATVNGGL